MLSIVQLMLHRPDWIVIDDIGDLAAGGDSGRIAAIFREELAGSAIIAMGTEEMKGDLFTRTIRLVPARDKA
jgi:putative ATP-binding cassette transporter